MRYLLENIVVVAAAISFVVNPFESIWSIFFLFFVLPLSLSPSYSLAARQMYILCRIAAAAAAYPKMLI